MNELVSFMKSLDEENVLATVRRLNDRKADPLEILSALQEGMRLVGEEYAKSNYFLSELIMSSTIFKEAVCELKERIGAQGGSEAKYGVYVIGTVQGDIHDIGKDITANLLGARGFRVVDLGVDQAPQVFVDAVREHNPTVVGLSCLLTSAFEGLKATVEVIRKEAARPDLPIMIGGATITEEVRRYVGADVFCTDANAGVILAQRLAGGLQ